MSREVELSDIGKKKTVSKKSKVVVKEKPTKIKKAKKKTSKDERLTKKVKRADKKSLPSKKELKALNSSALEQVGYQAIEVMRTTVFDKNREQAAQYEAMFTKLVTIKTIAETKYLESKQSKDIYALMKVYDQMREVIADMKALQDVGEYIDALDQDVLQPFATQSGQSILEMVRALVEYGGKHFSPKDAKALSDYVKKQGKLAAFHLKGAYEASLENSTKILVG